MKLLKKYLNNELPLEINIFILTVVLMVIYIIIITPILFAVSINNPEILNKVFSETDYSISTKIQAVSYIKTYIEFILIAIILEISRCVKILKNEINSKKIVRASIYGVVLETIYIVVSFI